MSARIRLLAALAAASTSRAPTAASVTRPGCPGPPAATASSPRARRSMAQSDEKYAGASAERTACVWGPWRDLPSLSMTVAAARAVAGVPSADRARRVALGPSARLHRVRAILSGIQVPCYWGSLHEMRTARKRIQMSAAV